jgi:hypothetical protein
MSNERKRVSEDVIEIGQRLVEAKALAGHGNWLPWLEREFGWTDDTALNYMRVYEKFKNRNFRDLDLPVSSLYLLAVPSTPREAVETVIERAETGEKLTGAEVKKLSTKPSQNHLQDRGTAELNIALAASSMKACLESSGASPSSPGSSSSNSLMILTTRFSEKT